MLKRWNTDNSNGITSLADLFAGRSAGLPVRADQVQMIPIFGSATPPGTFAPPESALTLREVHDYGSMTLKNVDDRPTIAPLNLGYLQRGAQNHAMCTAWIIDAFDTGRFEDACCIQEAQGGYIEGADERFIVLPHPLRHIAFVKRGEEDYSKLWDAIASFNERIGLKNRGHLDELKQAHQPELLRSTYRLERHAGQTGAVYLCQGEVVGIELAPDVEFWTELHRALAMYTYAPLRLWPHVGPPVPQRPLQFDGARSMSDLRAQLELTHEARAGDVGTVLRALDSAVTLTAVQRTGDRELLDVEAGDFVGQVVLEAGQPAYVSLVSSSRFVVN